MGQTAALFSRRLSGPRWVSVQGMLSQHEHTLQSEQVVTPGSPVLTVPSTTDVFPLQLVREREDEFRSHLPHFTQHLHGSRSLSGSALPQPQPAVQPRFLPCLVRIAFPPVSRSVSLSLLGSVAVDLPWFVAASPVFTWLLLCGSVLFCLIGFRAHPHHPG